ncbi:TetR/AcrR family transcriptional regulator [Klebsiella michiganensis]|uniref:TetR/AcrR family transcriptional regulator n=1 Tax=Klebsiella michiganensis TaxID=1134687 RepID=UPI0022454DFE|nr:TetR/AcrR family transcriptional regulator [Klebsiella michiganensis]EKV7897050.1 TetR/AcrR family transcriptional regulator [Klebsiella michiganensis]MCW9669978.1 TetR/AcrR family transcriptional regulator [Klebsiella michiganensis]MDM4167495.1 TetR/AcrR family transcriptional regulator [Klebsiella michiganensis]HBM3157884.1 TetR/AcrR family transcriptional regulator [Klebsiella michiganensis]HCQ8235413.1 TetR/AcrR family transcriptional regulator [Klebsiella michiganensis]
MNSKRKIQLADFNRTVILTTANTLFLSRGIESTTMDEIAHEAGFSKTTLYTYFDNKKDILDHLILEVMARFYQKLIPIANRQNSFREFYRELCQALMALHETSLAYFSAVAGKIACSEKITKNNKALKNIAMTGEQIHQIIAKRITDAAEKKELGLNAPVADVMMLFWLCLTGIVEKSSYREECLLRHLEKDRKAFLNFAFDALLFMIEKGNISDCEKAD